jgi:hypothetical protein
LYYSLHLERHLSGVGQTTGRKYEANFTFNTHPYFSSSDQPFTDVSTVVIAGPGPGSTFVAHFLTHVTINANGVVTADVTKMSVECR